MGTLCEDLDAFLRSEITEWRIPELTSLYYGYTIPNQTGARPADVKIIDSRKLMSPVPFAYVKFWQAQVLL
jgi:hypothetical protein